MKSLILITAIFTSFTCFAVDVKLLDCSDKYNSLTVTVNNESGQVNILRNPWQRGLMYVDRLDQTEVNPVVVHRYENLEYSALLTNAKAVINGKNIEITFEDKKATKVRITVEEIKEGQGVKIISENKELVNSILKSLLVTDSSDLSFYSSRDVACTFKL